jgi:hypothetical protein
VGEDTAGCVPPSPDGEAGEAEARSLRSDSRAAGDAVPDDAGADDEASVEAVVSVEASGGAVPDADASSDDWGRTSMMPRSCSDSDRSGDERSLRGRRFW